MTPPNEKIVPAPLYSHIYLLPVIYHITSGDRRGTIMDLETTHHNLLMTTVNLKYSEAFKFPTFMPITTSLLPIAIDL